MDDAICPACGAEGKGVKAITLRSLLRPEKQTLIDDCRYFFCGAPGCEIVYFSDGGSRTFIKTDLTLRVGDKEYSPPSTICYCFGHSVEEIFEEVERTGKSTVADKITGRIKEEGCSCETKNPSGTCCLETLQGYVREAYARFGVEENAPKEKGNDKGCYGPGGCCK